MTHLIPPPLYPKQLDWQDPLWRQVLDIDAGGQRQRLGGMPVTLTYSPMWDTNIMMAGVCTTIHVIVYIALFQGSTLLTPTSLPPPSHTPLLPLLLLLSYPNMAYGYSHILHHPPSLNQDCNRVSKSSSTPLQPCQIEVQLLPPYPTCRTGYTSHPPPQDSKHDVSRQQ